MPPEIRSTEELDVLYATLAQACHENARLRRGRLIDAIIIVLLTLGLLVASWKLAQ